MCAAGAKLEIIFLQMFLLHANTSDVSFNKMNAVTSANLSFGPQHAARVESENGKARFMGVWPFATERLDFSGAA